MKFTVTSISDEVDIRVDESQTKVEPKTVVSAFIETVTRYAAYDAMAKSVESSSKNSKNSKNNKNSKNSREWVTYTWGDYYNIVRDVAIGFINLGLEEGDGVAILGFNSPEWFFSNMAAIMVGGVSVGIYATNSSEVCEYIIKDSNSKIVVVENNMQYNKIKPFAEKLGIAAIIIYDGSNPEVDNYNNTLPNTKVMTWDIFYTANHSINQKTYNTLKKEVDDRINSLKPNKCCSLIYTSGTTGLPKGVMLSHDNIVWTTQTVVDTIGLSPDREERIVSYLPLSHIAAQAIDIYLPIIVAGTTYFALPSALKGTLGDTLKEVKPTIFFGVPRVFEKMVDKISSRLKKSWIKKKIFNYARRLGLKKQYLVEEGRFNLPFGWDICDKYIFQTIKEACGLDKCHMVISGAAPISKDTLEFFASINIPIYEVYGMSESTGPITFSYPFNSKLGTCGSPCEGAEVIIMEDTGEICVRGRNVMMGYLNQPDKTAGTIDDEGWLHTEDIGEIEYSNGNAFLKIVGRIKDLIITSGGENIPPTIIEDRIKGEIPELSNCMVIGDNRNYLTCLLTLKVIPDADGVPTNQLDPSVTKKLKEIGSCIQLASDKPDKQLYDYLMDGIKRANELSTSNAQKVQKYYVLPHDFAINDELGPTLKLKRNVVLTKYEDIINGLYA